MASISDYPLLGAVLYPAAHLAFFETPDWDPTIHLDTNTDDYNKPGDGIFAMTMQGHPERKKWASFAGKDEVKMYIGGISPVDDGFNDLFGWWKQNQGTLPAVALI
ncbi:hypothetical protein C8J57DRAFT_1504016 [Mycena rebaudengoi]|nr:hypothetical protein C8J57DRAFT_1504016 [Mycena rebaudengoi]